jgi:hypothetical protein
MGYRLESSARMDETVRTEIKTGTDGRSYIDYAVNPVRTPDPGTDKTLMYRSSFLHPPQRV